MGAGSSHGLSYEERQMRAFLAQERRRKRAIRQEEASAKKAERREWLHSYRQRAGEGGSRGGWGPLAWLKWPVQWWKERKAWEREEVRRAREQDPDHELTGLTSAEGGKVVRSEGAQSSGVMRGGPVAENGRMRRTLKGAK